MYGCLYSPGRVDLVVAARRFSPVVEETAPGLVVFEVVPGWDPVPPEGCRLAVAPNADTAVHAALGFDGVTRIAPGQEAAVLAPLPLQVLSPSPAVLDTLRRWGVRTFGEFAALPDDGVAARLGQEGVRLQKLARGTVRRPLLADRPPARFEESLELDHRIELLEPLVFLLARLLGQLCDRLAAHGFATNELRLALKLEGGSVHARSIRLPYPMRHPSTFLKLLQFDLEANPPAAAVIAVALSGPPVDPRVVQHGLFLPREPQPEKLELTLARIARLVGRENVGTAELLDTHRPGAFRMRWGLDARGRADGERPSPRLAVRLFRPPLAARVQAPSGVPARLEAHGLRGRIVAAAGPWRTAGDWWTRDPWDRDEWDVALGDGALYRLRRDHSGWFVEGSYD